MWLHTAGDIKSITSAVPEAKSSQTQIADGHRMTRKMDDALKREWCVEGRRVTPRRCLTKWRKSV